jgi:hypothetical protein
MGFDGTYGRVKEDFASGTRQIPLKKNTKISE